MDIANFSHHHPIVYRRLLVACCVVMAITGLYSIASGNRPRDLAMDYLSLSVPQMEAKVSVKSSKSSSQSRPPDGLTNLPGRDGSGAARMSVAPATAAPPSGTTDGLRALGRSLSAARFGDNQWSALNNLWTHESNWNAGASNRSSGACGIPQALPCSKIPDMSPQGQISWGLSYIEHRYGNPSSAWQHWQHHHWY